MKALIIAQDLQKRDDPAIAAGAGFAEVEIAGEVHATIRLPVLARPADFSRPDPG